MKKLSEYKNEEALDILCDLIDPVAEISADKDIRKALKEKGKLEAIKVGIKNHKHAVIEILAILDGEPVEGYECSVLDLPIKVVQLLNDPELLDFFKSQGLDVDGPLFGSATENTQEIEATSEASSSTHITKQKKKSAQKATDTM